MKVLTGTVQVSLADEGQTVKNKSGNLLELSRDIEGSAPTDRIISVVGSHVNVDEDTDNTFYFKEREGFSLDYGFGMYDRNIEVYSEKQHQYVMASLFWSTETGNYLIMPSMLSAQRNWKAVFTVTRGEPRDISTSTEDAVDAAFTEGMTKVEKVDFLLTRLSHLINPIDGPKFTQEEAECLATHRHYKGGMYRELGRIRNADDGLYRTLYLHLFPHDVSLWHRDTEEFDGFLNTGEKRFAPIEDELPFILNDDGESTMVEVVLRRLTDEPISGIRLSERDAMNIVPLLNERATKGALFGEYGQPKVRPGVDADTARMRFMTIPLDMVCVQFIRFSITEVVTKKQKRVKALTAQIQPAGPLGIEFLDLMRVPGLTGFAMRCIGDYVQDADEAYMVPKQIITFDFVPKKK